ncbi:DUF4267 domain-containing protein [Yinghuangia aomiensis]
MTMKRLATVLSIVGGLFIFYIGTSYLVAPQSTASGFGLPTWPTDEGRGFLAVKGVRDIASGLVIFTLLLAGHRRALGWVMLATAFVPAGDMTIVLTRHGSTADALGIHGATAAAVLLTAVLLLREPAGPAPSASDASTTHPSRRLRLGDVRV